MKIRDINFLFNSSFIKDLRKSHSMSQMQLAKELDLCRNTISALENGNFQPSVEVLFRLCEFFDVGPYDLIIFVGES